MFKKQSSEFYTSVMYVIVGLLLVIFKSETINWAMTAAGAFFIITGALDVYNKNYNTGGVNIAIGVAIIVLGWVLTNVVLLILGLLIAARGGLALYNLIMAKKTDVMDLLYPALTVVTGLVLAFGNGLDILIVIVGLLLIANGAFNLYNEFKE